MIYLTKEAREKLMIKYFFWLFFVEFFSSKMQKKIFLLVSRANIRRFKFTFDTNLNNHFLSLRVFNEKNSCQLEVGRLASLQLW